MVSRPFWDDYARHYDAIWDSPITAQLRRQLHEAVGAPGVLVDLGCGTGLLAADMRRAGARVVGVDTSLAMLERAVAAERIDEAICAPAEAVPLPDGVADAVVVGNLLHVHEAPEAVLAEARRLAAAGAPVVVCWPAPGLSPTAMFRLDRGSGRPWSETVTAHALRTRVGILALSAGGATAARARGARDSHALERLIREQQPRHDLGVVAGCQRVVVL